MKLLQHTLITLCIYISGCQSPDDTSLKDNTTTQQNEIAQTLTADFTSDKEKLGEIYDFFDIAVRTERGNPKSKPATFGRKAKVNTVRMLGGWYNQDLTGDTYIWDGEKYVYNFKAATDRIDSWLENDWDIFQIVLDNPPWAFQRGYTFVEESDGIHYLAKDRIGVYGNGLPPKGAKAWHNYISAFIKHLVSTYGEEKVNSWRFRIGSEIDTRPQHWAATQQEFFEHYQNTVSAIKSVLPNALVGTHFREATHKSKYIDYTGNTEDAYAPNFVRWAKQNNVPYDFLAISYYPHITHPQEMDMHEVYQKQIAPILEHPDYNTNADFEIHEYKFIVKMKRAGFVSVATSHNSAFFAMLSKMMLEKNIKDIYQWGNARDGSYSPEAMTQLALNDMVGNTFYRNTQDKTQSDNGNYIDGIFSQKLNNQDIDILIFSFNKDNMEYQKPEPIKLSMHVDKPAGTQFKYRVAQIDNTSNIDQLFFADHPEALITQSQGGWRKNDAHPTASATNSLNETGLKVYKESLSKYGQINSLNWGEWRTSRTKKNGQHENSTVEIKNTLPSFAVQKYQVQW
ncbi:hypothetical protein [Pseudoalteromonas sp. APC 3355]|uniref:GH39 family glycosyl hydrolase n=1 Tax=Pseudoalteromonas sp. APC 3355 TaxID=3035199 RepID=UPI0025B41A76|nr:hypothetical protein [Pseudoalteromonas sp. APC 3355]MDN3476480.1 hypothetical protein [Pseudoalteromonas sp. APC 3355]